MSLAYNSVTSNRVSDAAASAGGLDRLAFGCLWAFVMALPWEGNTLVGGFVITWWLGALTMSVAALRLIAFRRLRRVIAVHWFMAAFVCWTIFSLMWTIDQDMTLSRIGSFAQLLIMVWLIWDLAYSERRVTALLYAYCLGTCVSSCMTIRNLMIGMTENSDEAVHLTGYGRYAPVGFDQNELALLLALGVPISFYLLCRTQGKVASTLCWLQIVLASTAILLTGSRAGILALIMAALIVPFTIPYLPGWKRPFCLLVLGAAAVSSIFLIPVNTWQRFLTIPAEFGSGGTLDHRTVIWAAGLEVFRQHPFLGVGAGAFGPSVVGKIDINYVAHNSFLSVLVELGVVGALILALVLAGLFYMASHMPRLQKRFWTVELLTWIVGVSSLTWEYRKITWFLFGIIAAQAAISVTRRRVIATAVIQVRNEPHATAVLPVLGPVAQPQVGPELA